VIADSAATEAQVLRVIDLTVGFGSEVEEQAKAFKQLQFMLLLAIVLV
jgi:hypothetical protein